MSGGENNHKAWCDANMGGQCCCGVPKAEPEVLSSEAVGLPPCDVCGLPQKVPGALRFGPPRRIDGLLGMWCQKIHVCIVCEKGAFAPIAHL